MRRWSVYNAPRRLSLVWRRRVSRNPRMVAILPLILLGGACLLTAVALSSCGGPQSSISEAPSAGFSAPTEMRVRLTPSPLPAVELSTTGGYRLLVDQDVLAESPASPANARITRQGGTWVVNGTLSRSGIHLILESLPNGYVRFHGNGYRGRMVLSAAGDNIVVVNSLDVESYLAGVLAKELYPKWSYQTYRALAIAARTYALYQKVTNGSGREYDVTADQSSQMYGGFTGETDMSRRVVLETRGQVLAYGPPGREQIFMTQYSASCGGHVNASSVIRNAEDIPPYSGGQACDDCVNCSHYRWEPVRIPRTEVLRAVTAVYPNTRDTLGGTLVRIDSKGTTPYGRIVWLELVGQGERKVTLRAEDLRLSLIRVPAGKKLYSMNCQIRIVGDMVEFYDGKGFGHGVGLCQWGAQGKAEKGWIAEQILQFYYPQSKIFRVY